MDISDPSKLSKAEWQLVCGMPIVSRDFDKGTNAMIKKCSAKFGKFMDSSVYNCQKYDGDSEGKEKTAQQKADEKAGTERQSAAFCGAVNTLVRVSMSIQIQILRSERSKTECNSFNCGATHCTAKRPHCRRWWGYIGSITNHTNSMASCMWPVVADG